MFGASQFTFDSIIIRGYATLGAYSSVTTVTITSALIGDSSGAYYLFDSQVLKLPTDPLFMQVSMFFSAQGIMINLCFILHLPANPQLPGTVVVQNNIMLASYTSYDITLDELTILPGGTALLFADFTITTFNSGGQVTLVRTIMKLTEKREN